MVTKRLPRFTVRQIDKAWRVYDTWEASYPYQRTGLGVVAQDVATEAEAQTEADRLNKLVNKEGSAGVAGNRS